MTNPTFAYRHAHGLCLWCGRIPDQRPYKLCSHCYTPHPRQRTSQLFPGVRSRTPEYQRRYRRLRRQQRQQRQQEGGE